MRRGHSLREGLGEYVKWRNDVYPDIKDMEVDFIRWPTHILAGESALGSFRAVRHREPAVLHCSEPGRLPMRWTRRTAFGVAGQGGHERDAGNKTGGITKAYEAKSPLRSFMSWLQLVSAIMIAPSRFDAFLGSDSSSCMQENVQERC